MKVTLEDVDHIATLARVGLEPDEKDALRANLEEILTYVDKLQALDTDDVEATSHIIEMPTPLRDDRVVNPEAADAMISNAPDTDRTFLRVPKIID